MKVLDNIGLGLLVISIASVIFWSPGPYSISHVIDNAMDKVSRNEDKILEKAKIMPSKPNFATRNTMSDNIKEEIDDDMNSYRDSLSRTYEKDVKPISDKVSNWIDINKDMSTPKEHLNMAKEKVCEAKDASVEAGSHIYDAAKLTSKEAYDQTTTFAKEKTSHIINSTRAAIEKADEWIVDQAHEVFDKSGVIVDTAKNKVDNMIDATFTKMDMKNSIEFPNSNVSNIVGFLEEPTRYEDVNESNIVHNNLQLLSTNNVELSDVKNASNVAHNNMRLLGVDNSDDFITENAHANPQELGERCDQMSNDTGLNLIERSFTQVNNLWSTFVGDDKIYDVKNKLNTHKKSLNSNYKSVSEEPVHHQNKQYYEDTKKHPYKVNNHKYSNDDYYKDINYNGVKKRMGKYSNDLYNKIGGTYKNNRPKSYYDYAKQYGEEGYNNVQDKAGQYYEGMKMGYEGANAGARIGTLYDGLEGAYKGAKAGANIGYKVGKHVQDAKNHAHRYYKDARHKASKSYTTAKDVAQKFGKKLHRIESNIIDHGYDEDYDEDYNDSNEQW